ncbi:MAG: Mur ligase domain-containing protein, partial [Verrucomicrobiota bacterium]
MKLEQLLNSTQILSIEGAVTSLAEIEITQLCYDSRQVTPGALFFALPGERAKGTAFVQNAIELGAAAVVAEEEIPGIAIPVILVREARRAMGEMAACFYQYPSHY